MYSVLIVEDELLVCQGLNLLVDWAALGFSVDGFCRDGLSALEQLDKDEYDLLICDVRIPGMNGLELIHHLRERGLKCEVIVISAYAEFDYARRAIMDEALAYLLKPINEALLEDALRRAKKRLDGGGRAPRSREGISDIAGAAAVEIHDSYGGNVTAEALAKRFYVSCAQLNRLFRKRFGVSCKEYIDSARVERAQRLLEHSDKLVYEIAKEIGFRDIDYFSSVFKAKTGLTPTAYRKNKRGEA